MTEEINALKSIADISVIPPKKGNLYIFDIPENNVLMNWDASIAKQPDNVKAARKSIIQELKDNEIDVSAIKKVRTGEQFYWAIVNAMNNYSIDSITDSQQKASYLLTSTVYLAIVTGTVAAGIQVKALTIS